MTYNDLLKLAAAVPLTDEDYGSEHYILTIRKFYTELETILSKEAFETFKQFGLKATDDEAITCGLTLARQLAYNLPFTLELRYEVHIEIGGNWSNEWNEYNSNNIRVPWLFATIKEAQHEINDTISYTDDKPEEFRIYDIRNKEYVG